MAKTLKIEYMDGKTEEHYIGDGALVQSDSGQIRWSGGDGSYGQRPNLRVFPLYNVRTWSLEDR